MLFGFAQQPTHPGGTLRTMLGRPRSQLAGTSFLPIAVSQPAANAFVMFGQEMDQDVEAAEQDKFMCGDSEFHGQLR